MYIYQRLFWEKYIHIVATSCIYRKISNFTIPTKYSVKKKDAAFLALWLFRLCGIFGFVAFLALWLFWLRDFFGFLAFLALWLLWLRDFFGFVAFSALWRIRVKLTLFIPLKVDFNRLVLLMSIIYWLFSKTFVFCLDVLFWRAILMMYFTSFFDSALKIEIII